MNPGLPESLREILLAFFRQRSSVLQVLLFGSRARGDGRPGSDVDLAVIGDLDERQLRDLRLDLDDLSGPWSFDVTHLGEQTPLTLKEVIRRDGIPLLPETVVQRPANNELLPHVRRTNLKDRDQAAALSFWIGRSPAERLEEVERLRRELHGPETRLHRIAQVVPLSRG